MRRKGSLRVVHTRKNANNALHEAGAMEKRSILAKGAPGVELRPPPDAERAAGQASFRRVHIRKGSDRELLSELIDRAKRSEGFRRDVQSKMKALGAGRKGQPRPIGEAEHIVHAFDTARSKLRDAGQRDTIEAAADWLIKGPFSGRSRRALIKLYRQFRQ